MIGEGCCGRGVERNGGKGKDGVGESRVMNEGWGGGGGFELSRVAVAGTFCLFLFFSTYFFFTKILQYRLDASFDGKFNPRSVLMPVVVYPDAHDSLLYHIFPLIVAGNTLSSNLLMYLFVCSARLNVKIVCGRILAKCAK